jgi:hypothetical protein
MSQALGRSSTGRNKKQLQHIQKYPTVCGFFFSKDGWSKYAIVREPHQLALANHGQIPV